MTDFLPRLTPDPHNAALLAHVHPADWVNPTPARRYNLVVVGAGTAGLISAIGAAGLGARVALVERSLMGGDCLNVGCVPSKALLRSARMAAAVQRAGEFGVRVPEGTQVDFAAVMDRVRRLRAHISPHDAAARYRDRGVDVFFGHGRFVRGDALAVQPDHSSESECVLSFERGVIATGARAAAPAIPGLQEAGYLTNESVFELTTLPARLAVIGGGPIGCELAQAFARLGAQVTLLERGPHILQRDDPEAAERVAAALRRDGVDLRTQITVERVESGEDGKRLHLQGELRSLLTVDAILVGAGRAPNVEGLDLERAGVQYDPRQGVRVDDRLQTSNRRIFAAGDICSPFKFTHAADAMARIVIQNALFLGRARASALHIPWCTYTDPEVAHVGLSEQSAAEREIAIDTYREEFSGVDRAVLEGETEGFVKVHVRRGTDRIVGATIVASHAGELISELSLALTGGLGLRTFARTIYPYPTQSAALKRIADACNRTRLKPWVQSVLKQWLRWRRRG